MPPVYQQALRGTCVANAVTALLEYYNDLKVRLSIQFLYVMTREFERVGVEKNLERIEKGEPLHPLFEAVYHSHLLQLRMLADANGGWQTPAMRPYVQKFIDGVRERFLNEGGTLLRSCFSVVEQLGICRYHYWPTSTIHVTLMFGTAQRTECPPGAKEDALKRRVVSGLYLLGTPNNVDEIRGILAGANGRRPMPVVVTTSCFEGCEKGTFHFPQMKKNTTGEWVSVEPRTGVHGLLLVGYEDDPRVPGGGSFLVRNSYGEEWGNKGYGRMPYAYLECFVLEAGTILQDLVDYEGEGYVTGPVSRNHMRKPLFLRILLNLLMAAAIAALTILIGVYFDDPLHLRRPAAPSKILTPIVVTNTVKQVLPPLVVTNTVERALPPVVVTNLVEKVMPPVVVTNVGERYVPIDVPTGQLVRPLQGNLRASSVAKEKEEVSPNTRRDF